MKYRPEIDGLRAIAVLPVVFFHAGFAGFSGGYVGVDVFFVISGYLITSIICDDLEQGTFSLSRFYERRARRILPALYLMVLVSIPTAWFMLTPKGMLSFAQSVFGVGTFLSNYVFALQSGYFDSAAELKPLLHTWSLAVEEQFYVIFPLLMLILWRFGKVLTIAVLVLLFVASLTLAQVESAKSPIAGFFYIQTRAWELALGSLCAVLLRNYELNSGVIRELLAFGGLALIGVAVFTFDRSTPMPSLFTLAPVVGASLLVLFAQKDSIVGTILGHKVLVSVGTVSYSLYLWHQPIFVFYRQSDYWGFLDTNIAFGILTAISFAIAAVSWKYVEQPFRRKGAIGVRTLAFLFVPACISMITFGLWGHFEKGFYHPDDTVFTKVEVPKLTNSNVMLVGDSHAGHLYLGLSEATSGKVFLRTGSGCLALMHVDRYDTRGKKGECSDKMSDAFSEFAQADHIENIVVASMGPVYLDGIPFKGKDQARLNGHGVVLTTDPEITDAWAIFEIGLRKTFEMLGSLEGKNVVYVIDVPELGIDEGCNPGYMSIELGGQKHEIRKKNVEPGACKVPKHEYLARVNRFRSFVFRIAADFPTIKIFDPETLFCDDNWCYGYLDGKGYLYKDVDHLNNQGSRLVAKRLATLLQ